MVVQVVGVWVCMGAGSGDRAGMAKARGWVTRGRQAGQEAMEVSDESMQGMRTRVVMWCMTYVKMGRVVAR